MAKYCLNCGAELAQGSTFCTSCGANFEGKTVEKTQTEYQTQQPSQPPVYTPMGQPPRKSNKKLMAVVAILVVAIVVVAAVILILFVGGSSGKFVGTWVGTTEGTVGTLQFNSDGTFMSSSGGTSMPGTYEIKDGILVLNITGQTATAHYSFSNNYRTLTLTPITPSGDVIVLTKQ